LGDAEGIEAPRRARRRLTIEIGFAYLASWVVGIGYGLTLRHSSTWDVGASWERDFLHWMHAQKLPAWLDAVVLQVPLTGTNLTLLPAIIVIGWWLWKRLGRPIDAVHLLVVSIGSLSLNPTMKYMLGRDRPDLFPRRGIYNWASYPSGHAIVTTALYFTAAMMLYRERGWRWPFVVAALVLFANAHSRLYLAVHWPTDIIGGLVIGLVWLLGTWIAFARHHRRVAVERARTTSPTALAASQG
jgi:undecaprenyl-diphosphatase